MKPAKRKPSAGIATEYDVAKRLVLRFMNNEIAGLPTRYHRLTENIAKTLRKAKVATRRTGRGGR